MSAIPTKNDLLFAGFTDTQAVQMSVAVAC